MKTFTDRLATYVVEWAKRVFVIDPRSLGAFRVTLGSLVLLDLGMRAGALADHYSDSGLLPRPALAQEPSAFFHFCVHAWRGSTWFEAMLFAAAGALAVAFILGRGGLAVTVALWVMTVSLQNRNFMVLNKGDQILRLLLFWSMFIPLRSRKPVLSVGSAALLVQAALVWLVSASLKTSPDWFPDGTATYYALQVDQATTAFGRWIGSMFLLTKALTYGVFFTEWAAALLLFCPVWTEPLRIVGIVALAAMHVGFSLSMRLGLFPAISICSLVPFIPASLWLRLRVGVAGTPLRRLERPGEAAAEAARRRLGRAGNAGAAAALLVVLWTNAAAMHIPGVSLPLAVRHLTELLRLDQSWAMFAPRPWRETNWILATGRLPDGRLVNAFPPSLRPPAQSEPPRPSAVSSPRWLYYTTNLAKPENTRERQWFARYLCHRFDAAHLVDVPVQQIDIQVFRQWALARYQRTPLHEEVLWHQVCDDVPSP